MLQQLKIKIKTLATESQFTRQEERRGYDYTKQYLRDIKRKVREQRIEANKLKEQQYQQWKFQHFDPETEELREPFVWEEWKPQDIDLKEIKEIRDELKNSSLAKLQLAELRRVKLRNESRSLQLAYSFLRGKPYKKIEEPYFNVGRNKGRPDFSFIFSIIKKYSDSSINPIDVLHWYNTENMNHLSLEKAADIYPELILNDKYVGVPQLTLEPKISKRGLLARVKSFFR